MAPERRGTKGKSRLYMCAPCGVRHVPPTGAKCPLRSRIATRSTTIPVPRSNDASVARPVGRPPRVQPPAVRPAPPETDSDDDDDLQEMLHIARIQFKRAREEDPAVSTPPAKRSRPVPAPRRPRMPLFTPGQSQGNISLDSICDSEVAGPSQATQSLEQPSLGSHDVSEAVQLMLAQIASIQDANRIERQQMLESQERDRQAFMASLATVSARVDALVPPRLDLRPTVHSTGPPVHPAFATTTTNQFQASVSAPRPTVTSTPTAPPPPPPTPVNPFPAGQPVPSDVTPQQLQDDRDPVKTLRRNDSSTDMADHILKVVGILEEGVQGSKSKHGLSKRSIRKKIAKWPSDYVFRLDDDEPTYDSLSISEFMAGYLSIIEETLPTNPDNATAIKHIHYARHLMEDCPGHGWSTVRTAHKQVMLAIDHHRLRWSDTEEVYKTKADGIRRVQSKSDSSVGTPCQAYQNSICPHESDHAAENGNTLLHCCSHCFTLGKQYIHPLPLCMKKNNKSKDSSKSKNSRTKKPKKSE